MIWVGWASRTLLAHHSLTPPRTSRVPHDCAPRGVRQDPRRTVISGAGAPMMRVGVLREVKQLEGHFGATGIPPGTVVGYPGR